MTTLLYLFDLRDGIDPADYEDWATTVDLPRLRALPSVRSYRILRVDAPSGQEAAATAPAGRPRYVEVLDVASAEQFTRDLAQPGPAEVAAAFRRYADTPTVLACTELVATPDDVAPAAQTA
jgi:hypothetical protein